MALQVEHVEREAKETPAWLLEGPFLELPFSEQANVLFVRILDDTNPPEGYERCKAPHSDTFARWPESEPATAYVSDDLMAMNPECMDSLPWPVEKIGRHPYLPQTIWRRTDRDFVTELIAEAARKEKA